MSSVAGREVVELLLGTAVSFQGVIYLFKLLVREVVDRGGWQRCTARLLVWEVVEIELVQLGPVVVSEVIGVIGLPKVTDTVEQILPAQAVGRVVE